MKVKELVPIIESDQLIILYHNRIPVNKGFPYSRYDETYMEEEIDHISSSGEDIINIHIK